MPDFDVRYGTSDKPVDWRAFSDDSEDDDALLPETPASVVEMLGFDPLDLEKVQATDSNGHVNEVHHVHGLACIIETPKGDVRHGKDFVVEMPAHYGYIDGFDGADGDSIDCYVGPDPEASTVYVVDQSVLDGEGFDEHKCCLGFPSKGAALATYMKGHHRAEDIFMDIMPLRVKDFKRWLAKADKNLPAAETAGKAGCLVNGRWF